MDFFKKSLDPIIALSAIAVLDIFMFLLIGAWTVGGGETMTAQDIILAPGSVPFVPPGVEVDGETVYTSDEGLELKHVPEYCAIIGSGIIGLEFADVYNALGT